jgi:hypothetical protein
MKRYLSLVVFACLALLSACNFLPSPSRAYDAKLFAVEPIIVHRGERLYLRYRMALDNIPHPPRFYVVVNKEASKGVAYFAGPLSFPEYGELIEIPLYPHELEDFARNGHFFWRDPDGKEHPLKTITEG